MELSPPFLKKKRSVHHYLLTIPTDKIICNVRIILKRFSIEETPDGVKNGKDECAYFKIS
jgi:hypothetical protein